jgi:hypothetical protein
MLTVTYHYYIRLFTNQNKKNSRSKHLDSLVALNPMVRAANPEKTVWRIGLKVSESELDPYKICDDVYPSLLDSAWQGN